MAIPPIGSNSIHGTHGSSDPYENLDNELKDLYKIIDDPTGAKKQIEEGLYPKEFMQKIRDITRELNWISQQALPGLPKFSAKENNVIDALDKAGIITRQPHPHGYPTYEPNQTWWQNPGAIESLNDVQKALKENGFGPK